MTLVLEIAGGIVAFILILIFFRVLVAMAQGVLAILGAYKWLQWTLAIAALLGFVWWVWSRSWI